MKRFNGEVVEFFQCLDGWFRRRIYLDWLLCFVSLLT